MIPNTSSALFESSHSPYAAISTRCCDARSGGCGARAHDPLVRPEGFPSRRAGDLVVDQIGGLRDAADEADLGAVAGGEVQLYRRGSDAAALEHAGRRGRGDGGGRRRRSHRWRHRG